ncbi:MAG: malate synthase G, partial [Shimia sp.]|nr:malate synthase G [Shimia sp.]
MVERIKKQGLQVAAELVEFIEGRALPGTGVSAEAFWSGLSALAHDFGPKNRALLAKREDIQQQVDAWHMERKGQAHDAAAYKAFLEEIGYLVPEGSDFAVETANVDPEIAAIPGPQLVVPITNARFALNAANARWGNLYDALYGTDALGDLPEGGGYDEVRGARVIGWAKGFLDKAVPLDGAKWADVTSIAVGERLALATVNGEAK